VSSKTGNPYEVDVLLNLLEGKLTSKTQHVKYYLVNNENKIQI
jgi:hypothetical protein